ncbi:MAG: ABC transporter permease [Cyclobacteriaceae bacterium]
MNRLTQFLFRFFKKVCKSEYLEDLEGDLHERFYNYQQQKSDKANWLLTLDILRLCRPSLLRLPVKTHNTMLKQHLTISFRALVRNKTYTFINIGGLCLGLVMSLYIGLWVWDEISYNQYHDNYDTITKVLRLGTYNGDVEVSSSMVTGLGTLLKQDYGNYFEDVGMVRQRLEHRVLSVDNRKFTQSGYFVQGSIPQMFSLKMIYGSTTGLNDINNIFLSESVAMRLFGDIDPIGKTLKMDANWTLQVTGVYEDLPHNSVFQDASYLATLDRYLAHWSSLNVWDNYNMWIYAQLQPKADLQTASDAIKEAMTAHIDVETNGPAPSLFLHPMRDWHLYANWENGQVKTSNRLKFVWFFAIIGFFIVLLASINFINLSTAQADKRSKEVGIRKTLGSAKGQLIAQFLSESFLIVFVSMVLASVLTIVFLPQFNQLADKQIVLPLTSPSIWLVLLGSMLGVGILAGGYPAFFLSHLKTLRALKGKTVQGKGSTLSRQGLVIFQFTISIAMIIGTIIIYNQIQSAKKRDAGYDQQHLLSFHQRSNEYQEKFDVLKNELIMTGQVESVASSNYSVISTLGWNASFGWDGNAPDYQLAFNTISVNADYGKTVGWEIVEGRDFSDEFGDEKTNVIINESAQQVMGLKDPIGAPLRYENGYYGNKNFTIIGIARDMLKGSPYEATKPSIIFLSNYPEQNLYVRLKANSDTHKALNLLNDAFNNVIPSAAFNYQFADQQYNAKFKSEERIGVLAGYLATLSIFISCLGLFGLSSFMIELRTKEVGVRKVLGASLLQIWRLLSIDYIKLILIASGFAIPLSYLILREWLQGYEIQTALSWWIFASAGLGALLITLSTISGQAFKAGNRNPVESLRDE